MWGLVGQNARNILLHDVVIRFCASQSNQVQSAAWARSHPGKFVLCWPRPAAFQHPRIDATRERGSYRSYLNFPYHSPRLALRYARMVVNDAGERSFHLAQHHHVYRELNPYAGSQSSGPLFNGTRGHSTRGTRSSCMQAG